MRWTKYLIWLTAAAAVYGIVYLLAHVGIVSRFFLLTMVQICIYIIMALGLNLITGFTGQLSIGHAGFMSIGAYATGIFVVTFGKPVSAALTELWGDRGVTDVAYYIFILTSLAVGALAAALFGLLLGLPTLRLRGDYLAIATIGFGEIVRIVLLNTKALGGASGLPVKQSVDWATAYWLMLLSVVLVYNFVNSSHGRACISIRENEIAAETMGINTTKYKVMAFALGACFAGLAGGIYANHMYLVHPNSFGFLKSFEILVMVVLGGLGSVTGCILGAAVMTIMNNVLAPFPELRMIIISVLLVVMMIFRPNGLMGATELRLPFRRASATGAEEGSGHDL
ncbi:MAG: branched-chain amino acid ABC transporter permease [Gracilibacteraceae bacterium]|jgi:branched-chain amino acid transport system permease protein|nr:branched-chain amino acid ABC transporter permease [Gracilibacteraceae bacterium]